jgi:hypothetical protein
LIHMNLAAFSDAASRECDEIVVAGVRKPAQGETLGSTEVGGLSTSGACG